MKKTNVKEIYLNCNKIKTKNRELLVSEKHMVYAKKKKKSKNSKEFLGYENPLDFHKLENYEDSNFNSFSKSSVLNTLMRDCRFNFLSSDQIKQSSFKANAKYSTSLICGQVFFDSGILSEYSLNECVLICSLTNDNAMANSSFGIFDLSQISSQFLPNSNSSQSGDAASTLSENSKSCFLLLDIRTDIAMLASKITNIYINPFSFRSSNLSSLSLASSSRENLSASSLLNLLFDVIDLSNSSLSFFVLSNSSSNALSSMAFFKNEGQSTLVKEFISLSNLSGTSTDIVAILSPPNLVNKNDYLNVSISSPCCLRNISNLLLTFSSIRNLGFKRGTELDIVSASGEICCIMQSCFNMLFCERCKECIKNFFYWNSSFKHFQNLPDHDSCAFESELSMADLAVRNNIHVNLNSHEESNDNSIFKFFYSKDLSNYKLMLVTEAYNDIKEGKEVYFLDSFNKPARVKSIIKEKYNGKIYDVEKGKLEWQLPMEYQEFGYNNGYV